MVGSTCTMGVAAGWVTIGLVGLSLIDFETTGGVLDDDDDDDSCEEEPLRAAIFLASV